MLHLCARAAAAQFVVCLQMSPSLDSRKLIGLWFDFDIRAGWASGTDMGNRTNSIRWSDDRQKEVFVELSD